MIGFGFGILWLWLDGITVARPPQVAATAFGPLRRGHIDPILAARPEGAPIRELRRTRRRLDKQLREP